MNKRRKEGADVYDTGRFMNFGEDGIYCQAHYVGKHWRFVYPLTGQINVHNESTKIKEKLFMLKTY